MSFFKEFKEDLSKAVDELLPKDEAELNTEEPIVNTLDLGDDANDSVSEEMKEWLDGLSEEDDHGDTDMTAMDVTEDDFMEDTENIDDDESIDEFENTDAQMDQDTNQLADFEVELDEMEENIGEEDNNMDDNVDLELLEALNADEEIAKDKENDKKESKLKATSLVSDDDVTVITKGTTINGSISSDGSLDIMGTITGDVECLGKLSITGKIVGDSTASEIYVNTERMEGSLSSEGSIKVGLGTVIIGDVTATSGVIAGAIKGEIDINGPVVIDSTAIIKGNIKAKSVQINNGAVIEGFCSLSYAAVDVDNIFE